MACKECKKNNIRCVRIVHGKGYNSKNKEPVLKNKLKVIKDTLTSVRNKKENTESLTQDS